MANIDHPEHWEVDEVVNRNYASYWPRQNQLYGIMPAPKNTSDYVHDYLFPGDKLINLSDFRLKGYPENNFRFPRIPLAMRDHFLGKSNKTLPEKGHALFTHLSSGHSAANYLTIPPGYTEHKYSKMNSNNNKNYTSPTHAKREDKFDQCGHCDSKPDLCDKTACDLDPVEVEHWKELQHRNAAEDEYRRILERQQVLRILQDEVEAERAKYLAAKERLAVAEVTKMQKQLPPLERSSSPPLRQEPQKLVVSESFPRRTPPAKLPAIGHSPFSYNTAADQGHMPYNYNKAKAQKGAISEQTQTDPLIPATSSIRTSTITSYTSPSFPPDYKRQYLDELRKAADMHREKLRIEHDEMRTPFVDTITMLGADKPRGQGTYHSRSTDVTKPGMFLQFY